jgi:tRNA 2-thiouridine synthesizing protein A
MPVKEPRILDLRGLKCPMPVLKSRKAMRAMLPGEEIWVETTDPLAAIDIPNFCRTDGHRLVECKPGDGFQRFLIAKG